VTIRRGKTWRVRKIDITYVLGVAIAVNEVFISHTYNAGAFTFAAGCLSLPQIVRWEQARRSKEANGEAES
jgi:hypothetical protein